jgi:hypothetical protein
MYSVHHILIILLEVDDARTLCLSSQNMCSAYDIVPATAYVSIKAIPVTGLGGL